MLSIPPRYAHARPGGRLLFLWTALTVNLDLIRAALLVLPYAPACGVLHNRAGRNLVLIWTEREMQPHVVRFVLSKYGEPTDWRGGIALTEQWEVWYGEPYITANEYEPGADVPAWLADLQEAAP